ncbi:hypothetical protein D3C85_1329390 [compost metagenome]
MSGQGGSVMVLKETTTITTRGVFTIRSIGWIRSCLSLTQRLFVALWQNLLVVIVISLLHRDFPSSAVAPVIDWLSQPP